MNLPITLQVVWVGGFLAIALFFGRARYLRYLEPLIWPLLIAVTVAVMMDQRQYGPGTAGEQGWQIVDWADAIPIGIRPDEISVAVIFSALFFLALQLARERLRTQIGIERSSSSALAILFSASGITLAWTATTGWLTFIGIALTLVGGFLVLGRSLQSTDGSECGARVLREKCWGLSISMVGACAIGGVGGEFSWLSGLAWQDTTMTKVGAVLLCTGVAWLGQAIPFLSSSLTTAELGGARAVILGQLMPAWAAFALVYRCEPLLRAAGIFPAFGWYPIAAIAFASASGLWQRSAPLALAAWVSATASLAFAALAFAGRLPAISAVLAFGAAAGGCALLIESQSRLYKFFSLALIGAGIGFPGSLAAAGVVSWFAHFQEQILLLVVAWSAVFLVSIVGWKIGFLLGGEKKQGSGPPDWRELALAGLALLPAGGIFLTGKVFSGAWKADDDVVFSSILDTFVETETGRLIPDVAANLTGIWLHGGLLVAAL
ncbi:MAG: hypothetical protein AAB425_13575 [Bdellovibrionota bacterium]